MQFQSERDQQLASKVISQMIDMVDSLLQDHTFAASAIVCREFKESLTWRRSRRQTHGSSSDRRAGGSARPNYEWCT